MSGWWFNSSHGSISRAMNAMASGKLPNRNHLKISPPSRFQPGRSTSRRSTSSSSSGPGSGVTSASELLLPQLGPLEPDHHLAAGGVGRHLEPLLELAVGVQRSAFRGDLPERRPVGEER